MVTLSKWYGLSLVRLSDGLFCFERSSSCHMRFNGSYACSVDSRQPAGRI